MDAVQETIIFLTWTIRGWYLLTELFQITVINCKLALVLSLENPVFLSDFQLSQPFLGLFNLSTNSMSSWSLFPWIPHFEQQWYHQGARGQAAASGALPGPLCLL